MRLRKKTYILLSVSEKDSPGWWVDMFIIILITLNVLAIIIESIDAVRVQYGIVLYYFEIFSVAVFTVEYALRIWSAKENPDYSRLRYAFTPLAIIDLLAILPFFLPFMGIDLRQIRVLRLLRIIRLLKIARYIKAMSLIQRVIKKKKEELVITFGFCLLMLIVISSLMYHVEGSVQPDHFSSIPTTMWWGIATLTTVGYGDVYPITAMGKLLASLFAVTGIGFFALPAGIMASGFSDEISNEEELCSSCNQKINGTTESYNQQLE